GSSLAGRWPMFRSMYADFQTVTRPVQLGRTARPNQCGPRPLGQKIRLCHSSSSIFVRTLPLSLHDDVAAGSWQNSWFATKAAIRWSQTLAGFARRLLPEKEGHQPAFAGPHSVAEYTWQKQLRIQTGIAVSAKSRD